MVINKTFWPQKKPSKRISLGRFHLCVSKLLESLFCRIELKKRMYLYNSLFAISLFSGIFMHVLFLTLNLTVSSFASRASLYYVFLVLLTMKYHFILGKFMSGVVKKEPNTLNKFHFPFPFNVAPKNVCVCVSVQERPMISLACWDFEIESTRNFIEMFLLMYM